MVIKKTVKACVLVITTTRTFVFCTRKNLFDLSRSKREAPWTLSIIGLFVMGSCQFNNQLLNDIIIKQ